MIQFMSVLRSVSCLTAIVLSVASLTACGRESPESLMASAKQFLDKGDRNAAVIQLKNLLTGAPNNGEARLLLGQALLDSKDFVSAEKELSRALELKQPHEKVLPLYALALLGQDKHQSVISEVEKYKLFNPSAVATTQTAVGDAYRALGNAVRARDAYAAAFAAVPGYPRARLGEAMIVATEGRLDDALRQTDEVIAANPKLAEARVFRADILLVRGEREEAKRALEAAIEIDGSAVPARLALISLLIDERNFDSAGKMLQSTRKVAPGDLRVTYLDAALAFRKGELDRAREQVQQVLKFLPDHTASLLLASSIEMQSRQFALAEDHLRRAVALAPNLVRARSMLVATQLRMGQPARAKETLLPLLGKGMPQDTQLLLLAGETYLANGEVQQASTFFKAASTATDGKSLAARTRLGQIALASGRVEEGFKELESVAEIDAGQYQADLAIITGHLRRNEFADAMVAVQALEKKQPENPLTFQMYGVVNLGMRDIPAARRNFEKALELQPTYLPAAYNLTMLDLAEKRPEAARKRYEEMIARDAKNDQLYLALAELQARTGVEPKAIAETLQRAVIVNPQSVPARLALIGFHQRNRDPKAALTAAQTALAAMPNDPRILDAAGLAQESAGEINQAIETYNRLAALQPQASQPLFRLAALHVRQKDTDKAIETLRRVQRSASVESSVVPQIVQVYLAGNRPDEALKEARELQKRQPKLAIAHALEGEIHVLQQRLPEAERALREALKIEPRGDAVAMRLYEVLLASGKRAEADALVKKWFADNPKDVTMRLYLGDRALAAKDLNAAYRQYQAVIAIDQKNALALNNLAWIGGELGDQKAQHYAERALTLAPDNPSVLDTYAAVLVKRGRIDEALPYLERARSLAPERNDLRLNYAKALIKANRKDDARKELTELAKIKDHFAGKDEVDALLKSL